MATGTIDDTQYAITPPFAFTFNFTPVTAMAMSSNGYLSFNAGTTSFSYAAISSTTTGAGVVASLSRDLRGGTTGEMRWEVFGAAPDRYAVFQWKNWRDFGGSVDDSWNFQVILYETSNNIAIRYGSFTWAGTYTNSYQVGLRGATNADFKNRTTTTDWSATIGGTVNTSTCLVSTTVFPASGLQFMFNYPVATGVPNAPIPVAPTNGGWALTTGSLNWISGGGMPETFDVYLDTANPPLTLVSDNQTGTTYAPTLAAGTTYYWYVVGTNSFGNGPASEVWSFHTPTTTQLVESFEVAVPPAGWANGSSGSWTRSTSTPIYHGVAKAYKYTSTTTSYQLSTPRLTITGSSTLDFWTYASATSQVLQIMYSPDRVTWTQVGSNITYAATSTWYHQIVDLSSLAGSNYYLAFQTPIQTAAGSVYVDYVFGPEITPEVPGAPVLSAPADLAINVNEYPTLSWTASATGGVPTGYRLYLDTNPAPATLVADQAGLSYTYATPLAYNTTYYWTVEAYNGAGTSPQATVRSFTTRSNPIISTFPWVVDFGTLSTDWPVLNWSQLVNQYGTTLVAGTRWYQDDFVNVTTPLNKSAKMNIWSANYGWLVTPPIAIPATGYELKFDIGLTAYASTSTVTPGGQPDDKFMVVISDSPMMTNPTILREWNNSGSAYVYDNVPTTGETHIINLDAYVGTKYIAFYGESSTSNGDNDFFVDNVIVREVPAGAPGLVTLLNPANGSTGLDPLSIVASWAAPLTGGTPTDYYVFVSSAGGETFFDNQVGYAEVPASTLSLDLATIAGLSMDCLTTYYWAVQAHNASGDSDPEDPGFMIWSFTTMEQMTAPTTLALGSVWPNSVETGAIPVTNHGPTEMTFTASGPAEFAFGEQVRFTVPPASTYNLPYTFTAPALTGPYTGTITLTETSPGTSVVEIAVSATITDQVIVGTGTSDLDLPVNVFYGYTYSQTIYYASEISYPAGYRIEKLYYYFNGSETCESTKDYVIWMGHTTDATFASTASWIPLAGLTQIYAGENIPQLTTGGYWMEFVLNTPFIYNGTDNLVIAVDENTPGFDSSSAYFRCTGSTGANRSLRYYSDSTNPDPNTPPTGSLVAGYPNLQLYVAPIPTVPAISVTPESKDFGSVILNTAHTQQFQIMNFGGGTLTVNGLALVGDSYFSFTADVPTFPLDLTAGQSASFTVQYLPTVVGTHSATVTIDSNLDDVVVDLDGICVDPRIVALPHSENFDGVPAPALALGWTAYKSNTSSSLYASTSYSQTTPNSIYMYNSTIAETMRLISPEVTVPMNTFKMKFWVYGYSSNSTLKVGTVNSVDATGVFTEVATVTIPTAYAWAQYTVSFANYVGTDPYICFQHGMGATYQGFYIDSLTLEELMPIDLAATSVSGPAFGFVGTPLNYDITVYNNGTQILASYNVHLKRIGDDRYASLPVNTPLEPGMSATHTISWTPLATDLGFRQYVGEVEATGDGNAANNETGAKSLGIYPADAVSQYVGDPLSVTIANTLPLNFYWKNSVSETIYLASEINVTSGNILGLAYYNNFTQDLAGKPVKIWAMNTTATNDSLGWLDPTNYTLVYDGLVDFPIGTNTVFIPFPTPFAYTGGNIALRVNRPMDTSYFDSTNQFYYTVPLTGMGRSRHIYSDTTTFDPLNPGTGSTLIDNIPNTSFLMSVPPQTLDTPVVAIALGGADTANLTWAPITNATSYEVYASPDPYTWPPDAVPIAVVTTNSYSATLTLARQFFRVVAVGAAGRISNFTINPLTYQPNRWIKAEPPIGMTDNKD